MTRRVDIKTIGDLQRSVGNQYVGRLLRRVDASTALVPAPAAELAPAMLTRGAIGPPAGRRSIAGALKVDRLVTRILEVINRKPLPAAVKPEDTGAP